MHMGVAVRLTLFATDRATAERAGTAAFDRFAQLDTVMSDYQQASELNKLCARAGQGPVQVSDDLLDVLQLSSWFSTLTDGAFDVTVAPVVKLWRASRKVSAVPDPDLLKEALSKVGWRRIGLDRLRRTVRLDAGTTLDLGGIAKGYACDAALAIMKKEGVDRAMVEAGGDIAVSGAPPGENGWRIVVHGLDHPPFVLSDQAVSTSGDLEQFVDIGGVRYSHIVNPKTGLGLTNRLQATVIARLGAFTDPLATAACVLGSLPASLKSQTGAEVFVTHER